MHKILKCYTNNSWTGKNDTEVKSFALPVADPNHPWNYI